ncbi:MAG TPA: HAD-IC family P-type ATPase, partial [Saprospiraceae bacterium]|nr:HAD-IC family P-type ATPase [Saprospiraceae bacterium]
MKTIQQHTVPVTQLAAELDSDLKLGLSHAEALKRLQTNGPNIIQTKRKENLFHLLLTQFNNPMVYLLGFAALVSVWFEEYMDAAAIFLVIGINVVIGFWMELQAEQSMDALKGMTSVATKIIRDGVLTEIPSEEIVQGDVLFFEAGDMVTADARIIQATQLTVNESALTGESMPVEKNTAELDETTALADLTNMLFNGTFISTGNARAIATATGMHTELGKIAYLVKISKKSAIPLEKKLQQFTQRFIYISLVIVVLVFIAGMVTNGNSVELLKTAIALAVAAIPEGMPVVATLALAQGMLKMARHKVIVKKLAAVETLGGTTVICTDKTGTLTENKILLDSVKL